jgi:hypothetical protein
VRGFGWMFVGVGLVLAGISAKAISDPTSPIGWDNWTDDPWSQGLIAGAILAAAGMGLLIANGRVDAMTNQHLARALWTLTAGAVGFLMFGPFLVVSYCADTTTGGYCRDQEWSTVLGVTFEGGPTPLPGLIAGIVATILAWVAVGRVRRRRAGGGIA